jgi:uncharacterized protein YkwD
MMRFGVVGAMMLAGVLAAPGRVVAQTPFEREVLAALNAARTDPAAYAEGLRQYRGYFRDNLLRYPGTAEDIETEEGVAAVDEAAAFLDRQRPLLPLEPAPLFMASARDLVIDQAEGGTGHDSRDGSSPADRARRHGGGGFVAEVIAYGPADAADVVRQLIVDDGVADRGHRVILYSPELRFVGVACGPHAEYRTMCVIDLGIRPDGRYDEGRRTATR